MPNKERCEMKCEKCGQEFTCLNVRTFAWDGNPKQYLFEIPTLDVSIPRGRRVKVSTGHGEQIVTAANPSFIIGNAACKSVARAVGAAFPLKEVLGTIDLEVTMAETFTPFMV